MEFCCKQMDSIINGFNSVNNQFAEDGDDLIHYDKVFDEYGIIVHDGGKSYITINFCPWCGEKLPKSMRNIWFDKLEKLGYQNPLEEDIPVIYKSDEWRKNK